MGRVRETLAAEAVLPANSIGFGDALSVVKRNRPDVVIVGFMEGLEAPLALGQSLIKEVPSCTLVALHHSSNADHILSAMRVGYKEYVVLPDDASRLRQVVHDAAYAPSDDDEKGMVVSFIGAKGGTGTTLLTAHLAVELAAIHRVLAIDMDFGMGDLASVLDLNPKDSIIDLLPRADRIDERMLTGSAALHRTKLHVLAQPGELDPAAEVNADDVYGIIRAAAKAYQYVLIDCGTYLDEAVAMSMNVSDIVVIITTPSVVSVRDAYRRIRVLDSLGVERERVRLVVNRNHRGAYVSLEDIQQNLGLKIVGAIPEDPRTVEQAINEGKLIREVGRKSEVARAISTLVALLTEDMDEDNPDSSAAESKGGFFSFFSRG
jgi:pilus assembly protein CpaE